MAPNTTIRNLEDFNSQGKVDESLAPNIDNLRSKSIANMTFIEREAYRRDVLKIPGPVDRWLIANSRMPWMAFQRDYLMVGNLQTDYVTCTVDIVVEKVRYYIINISSVLI